MRALSIRQPWAWLILHAGKDIENRQWPAHYRGELLVHAAKGMTGDEYWEARAFVAGQPELMQLLHTIPPMGALERGGIVGRVELVDCVRASTSPWFVGEYGFALRDPQPLPFRPLRGELGFFRVE